MVSIHVSYYLVTLKAAINLNRFWSNNRVFRICNLGFTRFPENTRFTHYTLIIRFSLRWTAHMSLEVKLMLTCQTQYCINNNLMFVLEWWMKSKELIICTNSSCFKDNLFIIVLYASFEIFLVCSVSWLLFRVKKMGSRAQFRISGSGFCLQVCVWLFSFHNHQHVSRLWALIVFLSCKTWFKHNN